MHKYMYLIGSCMCTIKFKFIDSNNIVDNPCLATFLIMTPRFEWCVGFQEWIQISQRDQILCSKYDRRVNNQHNWGCLNTTTE